MRILVILLFLLAEVCTNIKARDCNDNQDCTHYDCDHDQTAYCQHHHSHGDKKRDDSDSNRGSCHCTVAHLSDREKCIHHSDCTNHKCSTDKSTPYCRPDHVLSIFGAGRHCDCTECVENRDCHCPAGTTPHCYHHFLSHNSGTCHCNPTITSTSRETSTSRGTFTSKGSTTTTTAATTVTTTTSVPSPTVNPLSTLACHDHTDCSGHICPSDKHPYCKFDEYSTICHCTVCTEHKHCFCPEGLIGLCNFDYGHKNYSCGCALAPDTTLTVSTSSASVPTTTLRPTSASLMSTTNSTPIPTKTQPTTTSTSKSTSTMVSTASSLSVSSSSSATSPLITSAASTTSTSVPSTNPVHAATTGIRKCHTCGDANNSLSCDTRTIYLGNLQSCAAGEDFCMTDIVHDGHTYPKTYKRCVSEQECRNKWLHQSSDQEYCTNYGNVLMSGQYSCHFCCVSDGCNAGQVPDKSTFYTKA